MKFTIRDLCWLTLCICLTFGAYRQGVERTGSWIAGEIRKNGYYDDQLWMAAMFPVRDGYPQGKRYAMVRVYTTPDSSGPMKSKHLVEILYENGTMDATYIEVKHKP